MIGGEKNLMKISEFMISATGFFYSMAVKNWETITIFGILMIMSLRKIFFDVSQMEMNEDEDEEGGVEPWESLERGIRRLRSRMHRD